MIRRNGGFTFIEVLVASALVSVFVLSLVMLLNSGLKVWKRLSSRDFADLKVRIALEKMERDIAGSFAFKELPFQGKDETFSFNALAASKSAKVPVSEVARVTYYLDKYSKAFSRSSRLYRQGSEGNVRGEALIPGVRRLTFQYGIVDEGGEFAWKRDPDEGARIVAVKMEMELERGSRRNLVRTFYVPAA